jgi:hypothetical protein
MLEAAKHVSFLPSKASASAAQQSPGTAVTWSSAQALVSTVAIRRPGSLQVSLASPDAVSAAVKFDLRKKRPRISQGLSIFQRLGIARPHCVFVQFLAEQKTQFEHFQQEFEND